MPKKLSIAKEVQKVAEALQLLKRMEDANDDGICKCISCGKLVHWKDADGGHYISRARLATKLEEKNVNAQCKSCNGFGDAATGHQYALRLDEKYGSGTTEWLQWKSKRSKKYTREELSILMTDIKARIKIQEERLL